MTLRPYSLTGVTEVSESMLLRNVLDNGLAREDGAEVEEACVLSLFDMRSWRPNNYRVVQTSAGFTSRGIFEN